MRLTHRHLSVALGLLVVLARAGTAAAQVPIQGVTGTMVTPATAEAERKAEDAAASGAGSGFHRMATAVKGLFGIHPTDGVLDRLLPGTTVVVRASGPARRGSAADVDDSSVARVTEGSVVSVDKRRGAVVVKFGSGTTSTYVLREATGSGGAEHRVPADSDLVSLSYIDKSGQKVTHEFHTA